MAALGLRGAPPPIDDLMVAAVPPSPPRMEQRRFLSGESLYRWAVDHLFGDPRFDGIDGYFDFPRAMAAASMAVGPGAQARHQREHEDAVKRYHHEKAIFDQWHGLARWLAAFVNDITEWTSDSSLAAMPDGDLQRIAAQMVSKNQADIGATRRANRAAGHPLPISPRWSVDRCARSGGDGNYVGAPPPPGRCGRPPCGRRVAAMPRHMSTPTQSRDGQNARTKPVFLESPTSWWATTAPPFPCAT